MQDAAGRRSGVSCFVADSCTLSKCSRGATFAAERVSAGNGGCRGPAGKRGPSRSAGRAGPSSLDRRPAVLGLPGPFLGPSWGGAEEPSARSCGILPGLRGSGPATPEPRLRPNHRPARPETCLRRALGAKARHARGGDVASGTVLWTLVVQCRLFRGRDDRKGPLRARSDPRVGRSNGGRRRGGTRRVCPMPGSAPAQTGPNLINPSAPASSVDPNALNPSAAPSAVTSPNALNPSATPSTFAPIVAEPRGERRILIGPLDPLHGIVPGSGRRRAARMRRRSSVPAIHRRPPARSVKRCQYRSKGQRSRAASAEGAERPSLFPNLIPLSGSIVRQRHRSFRGGLAARDAGSCCPAGKRAGLFEPGPCREWCLKRGRLLSSTSAISEQSLLKLRTFQSRCSIKRSTEIIALLAKNGQSGS